jgi:predicted ester cyclase
MEVQKVNFLLKYYCITLYIICLTSNKITNNFRDFRYALYWAFTSFHYKLKVIVYTPVSVAIIKSFNCHKESDNRS